MSFKRPLVTLKKAGISLIDCDHKTPKAQEHGRPYIGIPQLKDGRITQDGARLISEEDFHHWRRKANPMPDDVILSRRCNPGESAYVSGDFDFALGQNLVLLRSDGTKVYPPFLRWLTRDRHWWSQVNKYINVGAVFDSLKCAEIPRFEIYLPPLGEQKLIADFLGAIDKKIQLNHQINQTLEQMAQAIFKSWFVDFEPVKAKVAALEAGGSEDDALLAAMQAIAGSALFATDAADADAPTQLARLQAEHPEQYATLRATAELFPSAMQESELGEIPEGWSIATLADFGDVVCGKTPSKQKAEYYGSAVPFIKIPDMHGNVFVTKANEYLSSKGAASQPKKSIPKGSVCVSCIATVGLVVIAIEDSHTNQQINSIVPKKHVYTPYLYFRMQSLNKHLHDLASGGSATLNLNTSTFSKIQIIKPAEAVLEKYHEVTAQLLNKILEGSLESQTLSELRDTLLPKLLSGELSISAATDQITQAEEAIDV